MKNFHFKGGLVLLLAVPLTALVLWSCSSSSTPSLPTGPTQGKGLVRGTVADGEGNVIVGASVYVDGELVGSTGEAGDFAIEVEPGTHTIRITVEGGLTVVYTITVEEGETVDIDEPGGPGEPGEPGAAEDGSNGSNGIGKCVSECTSIYNPSNRPVDPDAADIMGDRFNARPCVQLCKETGYQGDCGKTTDNCCNPFYSTTTDAADCGNLAAGSPCSADDECAGELLCIGGTCSEPLGEIGDACVDDADCQVDLLCTEGTCSEPTGEIGAPCSTDEDCGVGLVCIDDLCAGEGPG